MSATVSAHLDTCNINSIVHALDIIKIGQIVRGLIPRTISLTGLTSSESQVMVDAAGGNSLPGTIIAVTDGSDAPLAMILSGAVGAGEVRVVYDTNGLATLTFAAAVTAFKVVMQVLPTELTTVKLAREI